MRRAPALPWVLAAAGWAVAAWLAFGPGAGTAPEGILAPPSAKDGTPGATLGAEPTDEPRRPSLAAPPPGAAPVPSGEAPGSGGPPLADGAVPARRLAGVGEWVRAPGAEAAPETPVALLPDGTGDLARILEDAREEPARRAAAFVALDAADPDAAARWLERALGAGEPTSRRLAEEALLGARDARYLPLLQRRLADAPPAESRPLMDAVARLKDRAWSPAQATGEPDVPLYGDHPTAWAPKRTEMGRVWIVLEYGTAVRPEAVRIHESLNPGAVVEVAGLAPDGSWEVLWSGTPEPSDALRAFAPPLASIGWRTRSVRLVLDTDRRPGWEEIDAVALEGDRLLQWAVKARAATSYADPW